VSSTLLTTKAIRSFKMVPVFIRRMLAIAHSRRQARVNVNMGAERSSNPKSPEAMSGPRLHI